MHEDMRQLLNAYMDGELQGLRLIEIQTHLASCDLCRAELRDLRELSNLLHAAPQPDALPVEHFLANLTLTLPRRSVKEQPPKPGSLLWWLVPALLIGAWSFLRTTFWVTNILEAVDLSGLTSQFSLLFSDGGQAIWLAFITWATGSGLGLSGSALSLVDTLGSFGQSLFESFILQAVIVLLYWAWLGAWWVRRRPRPMKLSTNPVNS